MCDHSFDNGNKASIDLSVDFTMAPQPVPTGQSFVMGLGGGNHCGVGTLPVNVDRMGNATMPLGWVARSTSACIARLGSRHGSDERG